MSFILTDSKWLCQIKKIKEMFNINCQISLNIKLDKLNPIYYNRVYPRHATSCKKKSLLIIIIGLVLNFI